MKSCKKIVSCFLCIAILTSFLCVPASANDGIAGAAQDFFEWSVNWSQGIQNSFWKAIYGDSWMEDENGGWTGADRDELTARYNQYVSSLQTNLGTTALIDGGVRIYFEPQFIAPESFTSDYHIGVTANGPLLSGRYQYPHSYSYTSGNKNVLYVSYKLATLPFQASSYNFGYESYNCTVKNPSINNSGQLSKGSEHRPQTGSNSGNQVGESQVIWGEYKLTFFDWCLSVTPCRASDNGSGPASFDWYFRCYMDVYPNTEFVDPEVYQLTINSRPTSIVGDYGIIGDNGTIVHIEGNKIVDETGGTVYNPATGETQSYTDYAYDYSDRSYLLTLEDGNTIKVMYGDENITIHEGDTIYNIYYLIPDDSGSGGGSDSGDTPSGEDMSWWKQAWTNFTDKLFSILGNGGSSVSPDTAPAVPDDEETGEKGYSVIDLFVVLKDGTWAFITGIVSTAYDGFTGFVESVSSAGSFFTFYDEESEDGILFVPLEGGETIWD